MEEKDQEGRTVPLIDVDAVTFDDFNTLRYQVEDHEDIIYPILRALETRIRINERRFLEAYFRLDKTYRKNLKETLRESLLDTIVSSALATVGLESNEEIVRKAIDQGLATRKVCWFPDAVKTLLTLRRRGYRLGLISNTHWYLLENVRHEFEKYFPAITLSYEHGYVKPRPSIFLATLRKLGVRASRCLHVGDDPIADVQGAKRIGMRTAFIKRRKEEADADVKIEQLSGLLNFLLTKL